MQQSVLILWWLATNKSSYVKQCLCNVNPEMDLLCCIFSYSSCRDFQGTSFKPHHPTVSNNNYIYFRLNLVEMCVK